MAAQSSVAPVYIGAGAICLVRGRRRSATAHRFCCSSYLRGWLFPQAGGGASAAAICWFAGMLLCSGMALAQCETWRASTMMLNSAVTTTITGRIERREADDKGRWRYVVGPGVTEKPAIRAAAGAGYHFCAQAAAALRTWRPHPRQGAADAAGRACLARPQRFCLQRLFRRYRRERLCLRSADASVCRPVTLLEDRFSTERISGLRACAAASATN